MRISLEIKLADRDDIAIGQRNLRVGQIYFLYSTLNKAFEGPYTITEASNKYELGQWLQSKMIYVPLNPLSNTIKTC